MDTLPWRGLSRVTPTQAPGLLGSEAGPSRGRPAEHSSPRTRARRVATSRAAVGGSHAGLVCTALGPGAGLVSSWWLQVALQGRERLHPGSGGDRWPRALGAEAPGQAPDARASRSHPEEQAACPRGAGAVPEEQAAWPRCTSRLGRAACGWGAARLCGTESEAVRRPPVSWPPAGGSRRTGALAPCDANNVAKTPGGHADMPPLTLPLGPHEHCGQPVPWARGGRPQRWQVTAGSPLGMEGAGG